jgi:hypothetical protein
MDKMDMQVPEHKHSENDACDDLCPENQKNEKKRIGDDLPDRTTEVKRKARLESLLKSPAADSWPYELILVRHGQSVSRNTKLKHYKIPKEGNEAVSRSKKGDLSAYIPEFKNKHSSAYRLTDKGVEQVSSLLIFCIKFI